MKRILSIILCLLLFAGVAEALTITRGGGGGTTPAGTGDVAKVGTPTNHQVPVWTGDGTIKGVTVTGSKVMCTDANGEPVACTNLTDGALSTDNSTANNMLYKDGDGHIENLTIGNGLNLTTGTLKYTGVITEVDGHTDATNLTAAQVSNTIIYNTGQGAANVTLNLPAAASGYSALFCVGTTVAANKWRIKAAANDKIYLMAADGTPTAGSDAGYVGYSAASNYPVIGNCFAIWSFKTDNYDWIAKPIGNKTLAAE